MEDRLQALLLATRLLDRLDIPYLIGGSIASSAYGESRHTNDVDFLLNLKPGRVRDLISTFETDFYIDEIAVRRALDHGRAFNAIHFKSAFKMDFFVAPSDPFTKQQFLRRRREHVSDEIDEKVFMASPEDVVLTKLRWFKKGGEVSEQQLRDVAGVVKVAGKDLDTAYLRKWADDLDVRDLLEEVLNPHA